MAFILYSRGLYGGKELHSKRPNNQSRGLCIFEVMVSAQFACSYWPTL